MLELHFRQNEGLVEQTVQLVAVQAALPTQAVPFDVDPWPHPGLEEATQYPFSNR